MDLKKIPFILQSTLLSLDYWQNLNIESSGSQAKSLRERIQKKNFLWFLESENKEVEYFEKSQNQYFSPILKMSRKVK